MKKQKLETYGPRNMPLIRNDRMSDAEWNKATLEFDDTLRRMGKRITWQTKFHRCPECRATDLDNPKLQFGVASGLCMKCSDRSVRELLKGLR